MSHCDYNQGRVQPYSVEPSDHRLYVPKKMLLKMLIKRLFLHYD